MVYGCLSGESIDSKVIHEPLSTADVHANCLSIASPHQHTVVTEDLRESKPDESYSLCSLMTSHNSDYDMTEDYKTMTEFKLEDYNTIEDSVTDVNNNAILRLSSCYSNCDIVPSSGYSDCDIVTALSSSIECTSDLSSNYTNLLRASQSRSSTTETNFSEHFHSMFGFLNHDDQNSHCEDNNLVNITDGSSFENNEQSSTANSGSTMYYDTNNTFPEDKISVVPCT